MSEMTRLSCGNCGIEFDVPTHFYKELREIKGKGWYCPNGHSRVFGESDSDILRRERDLLRQRLAEKDDTIARVEREKAAVQGQVTKLKKRAQRGVCPCCNRTFLNVARHMQSKHPKFAAPKAVSA